MIIYWSMLLWIPLVYFIYSINDKEEIKLKDYYIQQGIQKKIPLFYAVLMFGYFIFWIGMRKYVADTTQYMKTFNAIPTDFSKAWSEINWEGKSPGFDAFNAVFKCFISDDAQVWLMTIALICGVCVLVTLRKYSVDFFFSSFLFITYLTFYWMMNGMRQFICVAVLFLCCDWVKDGKIIKFMVAVLLLSTIHTTALLMIPIYFVARSKPWSAKIGVFIVAIIFICIFAEPFFAGVDNALSSTAYAGSASQFAEDDGVNPLRVLFYAMPAVVTFIKRNELEKYYEKYPVISVCVNMSLVTAALYLVGMFTSGILIGRLPIYTELYNLILVPFLLYTCIDKNDRKIIQPIVVVVFVLYFYLNIPIYYYSDLTKAL